MKTCDLCGKAFEIAPAHPTKRFCSNTCRGKFHKKRADLTIDPICINCSKAFKPVNASQRYCCYPCQQQHYNSRRRNKHERFAPGPATCARCGGSFIQYQSKHKYCSRPCQIAADVERRIARREAKRVAMEGLCVVCGEPTISKRFFRRARLYCSARCRSNAWGRKKRNRIRNGVKVRWDWKAGLTLTGKVESMKGKSVRVLVAGSLHEVPLERLKRIYG